MWTAIAKGDIETVNLLLRNRFNVNTEDNNGCTALDEAMYAETIVLGIVKTLFEHGAKFNTQLEYQDRSSVLSAWVDRCKRCSEPDALLSLLMEHGAAPPTKRSQLQHRNSNDSACGSGFGRRSSSGEVIECLQGKVRTATVRVCELSRLSSSHE
jgi:ankyrin repeat protein